MSAATTVSQQSPQVLSLEHVSPHCQVAVTQLLGGDEEDTSLSRVQEKTCTEEMRCIMLQEGRS